MNNWKAFSATGIAEIRCGGELGCLGVTGARFTGAGAFEHPFGMEVSQQAVLVVESHKAMRVVRRIERI